MWLENLAAYSLQVAALIIAGTGLVYLFRLKAPAVLLAFWQALLAVCLLLPAFQPWRQVRHALEGAAQPMGIIYSLPVFPEPDTVPPVPAMTRVRSIPFPTYEIIALTLGAGAVLRLLWLAVGLMRLRHYQNKSRRLSALPESILDMQWRVGVSPEIFLSGHIDTPVTFGWRRPAVLFPESFTEMTESMQRPIACHELLHVERRDWLFIVLEEILRSMFWFHPAVWWALGRIHLSREQVVDREVLRVTGARGPYLESLLHIASLRGRPAAVPAPLLLKERHLVQRVALMLKESKMSKSRLIFSLVAIAAFLLWTGTFAAGWFPLTAPPVTAPPPAALMTMQPSAPVTAPGAATVTAPTPVSPPARTATPAPKAPQQEPMRVGADVQASKLIYKVDPVYPEQARQAKVEGIVNLEVMVDEQGNVASVRVIQGYPLLDQAAMDAVRQWRYSPTILNGQAVRVLATVQVPVGPLSTSARPLVSPTIIFTAGDSSLPVINPAVRPPQGEPMRVGGNVQESKIIRKVDPIYPELARRARVEQMVMLELRINEEGLVSSVRLIKGHPLLDRAAIDAVMQWAYSPTYSNGQAIPVIATATVIFSLSQRYTLDTDGYIKDSEGVPVSISALRENKGLIQVTPAPQTSFDSIQQTLVYLQAQGVDNVRLNSQAYVFTAGRLFYLASDTVTNPPAPDQIVLPPVLDINIDQLAKIAETSGRLPSFGGNATTAINFTVCVDEAGRIVAVLAPGGPFDVPEVVTALKQARVVTPGRHGNIPVPTATKIAIRVSLK